MNESRFPSDAATGAEDAPLAGFGIEDEERLVERTYYDLTEDGFGDYDPDPDGAYLDRVAETVRAVFAELADPYEVPADVDAALDDARHAVAESADGDADLRTEVLPAFVGEFAAFVRAYRR